MSLTFNRWTAPLSSLRTVWAVLSAKTQVISSFSPQPTNCSLQAILYSKDSPRGHLKKISECTRAMAFLGTPHRGSNKANLGHILARLASLIKQTNVPIVDVLRPDSELLNRMQEQFYDMLGNRRNAGKAIDITCFYEELDDKRIGEV
jgi:hypothetical protein